MEPFPKSQGDETEVGQKLGNRRNEIGNGKDQKEEFLFINWKGTAEQIGEEKKRKLG